MAYLDTKPYSEQHIANIRKMLHAHHDAGQDLYFEFKADDLVFIPKTNNLSKFDNYHDYINSHTQEIEFAIYSANPDDKNKKSHSFYLKNLANEKTTEESLHGITPQAKIDEALEGLKKEMQYQRLEEKFKQKEKDFEEMEEFANQVQEENVSLKAQLFKQGDSRLGHIAGIALESLAKRNAHKIAKVQGLEGIAELFTTDNNAITQPTDQLPEREVTFNQDEDTETLSDAEKSYLEFGEFMDSSFTNAEVHQVFAIVKQLAQNKSHIKTVNDLLNNQ